MLAHLLMRRLSPLWTFSRPTTHGTICTYPHAHSHRTMSTERMSLQLYAFLRDRLKEKSEWKQTRTNPLENSPGAAAYPSPGNAHLHPGCCGWAEPGSSHQPAPKPAQEQKYRHISELIGKQLRNIFFKLSRPLRDLSAASPEKRLFPTETICCCTDLCS